MGVELDVVGCDGCTSWRILHSSVLGTDGEVVMELSRTLDSHDFNGLFEIFCLFVFVLSAGRLEYSCRLHIASTHACREGFESYIV